MNPTVVIVAVLVLAAGCEKPSQPQSTKPAPGTAAASPSTRLQQLVASNATLVGHLYSPDRPYVIASFSNGWLLWRADPENKPNAQGQAKVFTEPDRTCVGFEQKNPSMQTRGPERYLVCEAVQPIQHSNSLPRSQDFSLRPGTLFLQYQPAAGTGFAHLFYASLKQ